MAEQMALGDILSDKPAEPRPQAPAPEAPAATQDAAAPIERPTSRKVAHRDAEQAAQGRVRDPETGQYTKIEPKEEPAPVAAAPEAPKPEEAAKPAAPVAAAQQEFTEKEKAFLRAAQEERGKRQALEARLRELEAAKPAEPAKTFWDDPEAAMQAQEARLRQESLNTRLNTAELIARQRHPDFDEKVALFAQVVQQNPQIQQQWLQAMDPAEFAYTIGKNHQEFQQVGSMEEYRAKIERETAARVRTEVEAELKAKAAALEKARADLPGSLSTARGTTVNRPTWSGPSSLDDILGGK